MFLIMMMMMMILSFLVSVDFAMVFYLYSDSLETALQIRHLARVSLELCKTVMVD